MFHAGRSPVPLWRNVFAIALSTWAVNCSGPNGSGTTEPAAASTSAAPVLRTANTQQTFGSGSGASSASSDATNPGSTPAAAEVGSTPGASSEALKDPTLLAPDAGTNGSVPPATPPAPSVSPQPSNAPSAQSDDDDDEDEEEDD